MKILIIGSGVMANLVKESAISNDIEVIGMFDKFGNGDFQNFDEIKKDFDIIIDFSHHSLLNEILEFAKEKNKPLLIATTGHKENELNKLDIYSKYIPIIKATNTSIGINALNKIVKFAQNLLKDFDIEIIEKHHNRKIDAPSGTAKTLFNILNSDNKYEANFNRFDNDKRKENEIGIHSIRAGNIYGEHTIIFSKDDEIIEIKHEALSRKIFADGAIKLANILLKLKNENKNGLFEISNLF